MKKTFILFKKYLFFNIISFFNDSLYILYSEHDAVKISGQNSGYELTNSPLFCLFICLFSCFKNIQICMQIYLS